MTARKTLPGLVPDHIAAIHPYTPGKPMQEVEREGISMPMKLASNENPLGPSPRALEAAARALSDSHRYPDAGGFYLREALSARHDIGKEHIVLGAGSTELIQLLCQIYLGPGRLGLTSAGTFIVFELSVRTVGSQLLTVPLKDYTYDLDALAARLDSSVRVVYLANPNNPTGTMFTADALDRFLARVPDDVLVILDEAYCDYVERSDYSRSLDYVREGRYLIVLRTFSKIYGLAGLRVGYGLGHPEVIDALNKVRCPFNVSCVAQGAALAALDDDEHLRRSVESNRNGLAFLTEQLTGLGIKVAPSAANFLYIETGHDPAQVHDALLQKGIIVRPLGWMGMPAGLRVTVGTQSENKRLVGSLATVLESLTPVAPKSHS